MKVEVRESYFLIEGEVEDNWLSNEVSDNRGVNKTYKNTAVIIIHYLMLRYRLSQRGALDLLKTIAARENWSVKIPCQRTIARQYEHFQRQQKFKSTYNKAWRYLVITPKEIIYPRYKPENMDRFTLIPLVSEETVNHAVFMFNEDKKSKKLEEVKKYIKVKPVIEESNNINVEIKNWLFNHAKVIATFKPLFDIDNASLFDALIPLFPRRKLGWHERLEDIFIENQSQKNKEKSELIRRVLLKAFRPTPVELDHDLNISTQLINIKYSKTNNENGETTFLWLRCNITKLNFIGQFPQKMNISNEIKYSLDVEKHNKTIRVAAVLTNKNGFGNDNIRTFNTTFPYNRVKDDKSNAKILNFADNWPLKKNVQIVKSKILKQAMLNFDIDNGKKYTEATIVRLLNQWLDWNNESAIVNNSDLNFFFGSVSTKQVIKVKKDGKNKLEIQTVVQHHRLPPFIKKLK